MSNLSVDKVLETALLAVIVIGLAIMPFTVMNCLSATEQSLLIMQPE